MLPLNMEESGWGIDKILSVMRKVFNQSHSRRVNYEKISGSDFFPLKFFSCRWAENKIAERGIEV